MEGFREFKLMILQYMYIYKQIKNENLFGNEYKRKFDMHGDIGEALSCAAAGKHSEIFDRREVFCALTFSFVRLLL
jgi:hypothetical protein